MVYFAGLQNIRAVVWILLTPQLLLVTLPEEAVVPWHVNGTGEGKTIQYDRTVLVVLFCADCSGISMTTEEATRALERSRAVRRGHRGVVTKLVHEAEGILRDETVDTEQRSRLSVIKQQLEGKLKLLNDMDRDILDRCEVDAIETEIDESELVIAKIINCTQQIDMAVISVNSRAAVASQEAPTVPQAKP